MKNLLPEIFPVSCHTNHIGPGSTFVALKGHTTNGTSHIPLALQKGARTFIVGADEQEIFERLCCCGTLTQNSCSDCGVRYEFVKNPQQTLAERAAQSLGYPAKKLNLIAITGTKGKTTTTYLIHHLLQTAGHKTALLGGVYNKIGTDIVQQSSLTTPTADYLQMFLTECVKEQVEFVVMEASSHAIDLKRIHGLEFKAIGFTNLGQDHLDYHKTMDSYFATKMQLFNQLAPDGIAVINTNDTWGKQAFNLCAGKKINTNFSLVANSLEGLTLELTNYTKDSFQNYNFKRSYPSTSSGRARVSDPAHPELVEGSNHIKITCPALFGTFNAENIAMAATICHELGLTFTAITNALLSFPEVPGRLQKHRLQNGALAFVDFAHNPSSFEAVLTALRPLTTHLIVIFGCGGNRDTTKRPLMGQVASQFADLLIITDDNPRFEQSQNIINDILQGVNPACTTICEPDRMKAIQYAVKHSGPHSIIALLGKGHEPYFLIQGQKLEFDDFKQISLF